MKLQDEAVMVMHNMLEELWELEARWEEDLQNAPALETTGGPLEDYRRHAIHEHLLGKHSRELNRVLTEHDKKHRRLRESTLH